jgi:hypothetical protein
MHPCEPKSSARRWCWPRASRGRPNKCFKTAPDAGTSGAVSEPRAHGRRGDLWRARRALAITPGLASHLESNAAGTPPTQPPGRLHSSSVLRAWPRRRALPPDRPAVH